MNTNEIKPTGNRVILEFFLGEYTDVIEDGIYIPASAKESMSKAKPKYRWVKVLSTGPGCLEVKPEQEVLVFEGNVEFIAVKGEKPFNYIQEGQIMAVRDAESSKAPE